MTSQEFLAATGTEEPPSKGELRILLREISKRLGQFLDDDQLQAIMYDINNNDISDKFGLTQAIHDVVNDESRGWSALNSNKDRKEAFSLAQEALNDLDMPLTGTGDSTLDWEGGERAGQKLFKGPLRALGNFFTMGAIGDQEVRDRSKDQKSQREAFARQLLADGVITGSQLNALYGKGLVDVDVSLEEVIDTLSDMGITDQVIEDALRASTSATFRRTNKEMERLEQAEIDADREEAVVSDDDKILRRGQFELLNEDKPGKYMWNPDNAYIYEVGSGMLIDGITGERQEIYTEDGDIEEGFNDEDGYWQEAQDTETPWSENNVDEPTYYSLLDVVEHPDRYHSGGIGRFAGGGQFLGGYGENYVVPQSEDEIAKQYEAGAGGAGYQRFAPEDMKQAMRAGMRQEVRRPWYDPDDDWALFAGMSAEGITERQHELVAMGALDGNEVIFGFWGEAEAQVTNRMMNIANGQAVKLEDISVEDWTEFWEIEEKTNTPKRPVFSAPSYRKMDPAAAQLTVEETVRRMLGRDASPDELASLGIQLTDMHRQSFVADVKASEAEFNAQVRANDSQSRTQAGAVQDVDWEAQFLTKFQESHGAELDRFDRTAQAAERQSLIGGSLNSFMNQLGGGIGGGN